MSNNLKFYYQMNYSLCMCTNCCNKTGSIFALRSFSSFIRSAHPRPAIALVTRLTEPRRVEENYEHAIEKFFKYSREATSRRGGHPKSHPWWCSICLTPNSPYVAVRYGAAVVGTTCKFEFSWLWIGEALTMRMRTLHILGSFNINNFMSTAARE